MHTGHFRNEKFLLHLVRLEVKGPNEDALRHHLADGTLGTLSSVLLANQAVVAEGAFAVFQQSIRLLHLQADQPSAKFAGSIWVLARVIVLNWGRWLLFWFLNKNESIKNRIRKYHD